MSADRWFVIKAESCPGVTLRCGYLSRTELVDRCIGCLGDGFRLSTTSAIPVEPGGKLTIWGDDTGEDDRFVIHEELGTRQTWRGPFVPTEADS